MSFDGKQFKELITQVLQDFDKAVPYSDTAVNLLLLTSAQESALGHYIKQTVGPAKGVFQIEPNTHRAMWQRLAEKDRDSIIRTLLNIAFDTDLDEGGIAHVKDAIKKNPKWTDRWLKHLEGNLLYQICMCRLYYYMVPKPLPSGDIMDMASYWKQYYNTPLGKGTAEEAFANYKRYVLKG